MNISSKMNKKVFNSPKIFVCSNKYQKHRWYFCCENCDTYLLKDSKVCPKCKYEHTNGLKKKCSHCSAVKFNCLKIKPTFGPLNLIEMGVCESPYHTTYCDPPLRSSIKFPVFLIWILTEFYKKKFKINRFILSKDILLSIFYSLGHCYCYICNRVTCAECSADTDLLCNWRDLHYGPICINCNTGIHCTKCHTMITCYTALRGYNKEEPLCDFCLYNKNRCIRCNCLQKVCNKVQKCFCDSCTKHECIYLYYNNY